MDRRLTPFSGRTAHISLADKMPGTPMTLGEPMRVIRPLAGLHAKPNGALDRELIFGEAVTVIDRMEGHSFVMAAKDRYCGWVKTPDLGPPQVASHRVKTPKTHLYPEARVQAPPRMPLYLNARVSVTGQEGTWAETPEGFIPLHHLAPLNEVAQDPVTIAESLLHSPYLWGGNSAAGVDCSGLVQLAFHAAGRKMAGDSDLQAALGRDVAMGDEVRGDLIFWKGHVALVTGPDRILHANGHTMSVAYEGLAEAIARIAVQNGGPVTARKRP